VTGDRPDPSFPPLVVSGLHVAKADLIAALRFYVPQLTDLRQLDDGSFLLRVVRPDEEATTWGSPQRHDDVSRDCHQGRSTGHERTQKARRERRGGLPSRRRGIKIQRVQGVKGDGSP
jgi:hypothetical protein